MIPGYVKLSEKFIRSNNPQLIERRTRRPVYALSLDGVSGSVLVKDSPSFDNVTNQITCVIKFVSKNDYIAGSDAWIAMFIERGEWLNFGWEGWNDSIGYGITDNGSTWRPSYFNSQKDLLSNIEYTIGYTYANPNFIGYKNGSVIRTHNHGNYTINAPSTDLYIGCSQGNNSFLSANIKSVSIFNVALTSTQVSDLYNGSIKPNQISGCVLYHDYTLGHAQDLSGNGNHGTLMGNAKFIITGYD